MIDIPLGSLINAAGGLVFVALGAWVLTLHPKRPATAAFGAYAIFFGLVFTAQNLVGPGSPPWWRASMWIISGAAGFPAVWALIRLASQFPVPLLPRERRFLAVPALAILSQWIGLVLLVPAPSIDGTLSSSALLLFGFGVTTILAAAVGVSALFAIRLAMAGPEGATYGSQYAFIGATLSLFPAFGAGSQLMRAGVTLEVLARNLTALVVVTSVLWLWASLRCARPAPARNTALLLLGICLAGMLGALLAGHYAALDASGIYGIVRMAEVLLVAYAILRMQLLGLDVKVRWTIKQSTIAAAFIGVFFVASEAAQQFFADAGGSQYLGIVAAGGLVFALAPLQRAAERLAEKAVPGVGPAAVHSRDLDLGERRALYLSQVKFVWADGVATLKERRLLEHTREQLGLDVHEAHRLEREALDALASPRPRSEVGR